MEPTFDANTYVYLDWAATAPLREEAAQAMKPFNTPGTINLAVGANANSLHSPGRAAFAAMEKALLRLAARLAFADLRLILLFLVSNMLLFKVRLSDCSLSGLT